MTWVIVPAAGAGTRMGGNTPKPLLPMAGGTVLSKTLSRLAQCAQVSGMLVVIPDSDLNWRIPEQITGKPVRHCQGGAERMHSVLRGLLALPAEVAGDDFVAVHDAARPCIAAQLVSDVIQTARHQGQGAIAAIPVADTLKRATTTQEIEMTIARDNLWQAQTPQVFRRAALTGALQKCISEQRVVSDEAMAMEQAGVRAALVLGSTTNIKITRRADLALAATLLGAEIP